MAIPEKYSEINFVPPQEVAEQAELGLKLRDEFERGGTEVGVARARDLKNKVQLSPETIVRMYSYFSRHEVDLEAEGSESSGFPRDNENPSAGWIAWLLWGGDAGRDWATSIYDEMKAADAEELEKIEKAVDLEDIIEENADLLEGLEDGDQLFLVDPQVFSALSSLQKKLPLLHVEFSSLYGAIESFEFSSEEEESPSLLSSLSILANAEELDDYVPLEISKKAASIIEAYFPPSQVVKVQKSFTPSKAFFGKKVSKMYSSEEEEIKGDFILGVVLEPTDGTDGNPINPDTDDDVYSAKEILKACHWYMEHGRQKGTLHAKDGGEIIEADDNRIVIVECFVTPVVIPAGTYGERQEEDVKAGTWLLAYKINDEAIQEQIRNGELDALSIGGDTEYEEL